MGDCNARPQVFADPVLSNTTRMRPFRGLPNQPAQCRNNLETFGAEGGIVSEGVAQVLEDLGNPSSLNSFHALRHSTQFFLFIAFYWLLSVLLTPS